MSESTFNVKETKFILNVKNMDRALKFYQDAMGLEVKMSSPHWSEMRLGTAIVALHGGGSGDFCPTGLSFTVDNIEQALQHISNNGGAVRSGPEDRSAEGIILADVTDPEGNGFMVSQNK